MATGWHMVLGGIPLAALSAAQEADELMPRLAQITGDFAWYPRPVPVHISSCVLLCWYPLAPCLRPAQGSHPACTSSAQQCMFAYCTLKTVLLQAPSCICLVACADVHYVHAHSSSLMLS